MKNNLIPIFLVITSLVLISATVYSLISVVNTQGLVEANIVRVQNTTIIVGKDCTAIVADTSQERAQSIEDGLQKTIIGRPNTHDIFVAALKAFNISLDSIQIASFDGQSYHADMILISGQKILRLDSRPSDAIAVAVRTNATIFINESLLQRYGQDICL